MSCDCLEYQRLRLQDGGRPTPSLTGMSPATIYPFKGLYIAIKTGRASFKGFRRLEALQRLNAYKDGVLKGYMGDDSQTLYEEL